MALPTVIDITKQQPGVKPCLDKLNPHYQLVQNLHKIQEIRGKIENLQVFKNHLCVINKFC